MALAGNLAIIPHPTMAQPIMNLLSIGRWYRVAHTVEVFPTNMMTQNHGQGQWRLMCVVLAASFDFVLTHFAVEGRWFDSQRCRCAVIAVHLSMAV